MRTTPLVACVIVALAMLGQTANAQTSVLCPDGSVAIPAATVHVGHEVCRAWGGSLPTEAQWEYSARGTDRRDYPSGATAPAWSALPQLPVIVEKAADRSPFGLVHMLSNAAEWTKSISPAASQVMRVVKGSRSTLQPLWARAFLEEHTRARDVGFRCAYPVNTKTPAFALPR